MRFSRVLPKQCLRPRWGWLLFWPLALTPAAAQQISIPRIEQMPNQPQPYFMRDWKTVALQYDSLVFNESLQGQYLPLIWRVSSPVNYPEHESFGLQTVVGDTRFHHAEAVNVLPAVIGGSLVGIDKSQQNGANWVLMCEEFFNRRAAENIYLNDPIGRSGVDWWYETMPNVFFYQLYSMYPHTGDFDRQFRTVADRWLAAVKTMGGSAAPWRVPYMKYRAFSFSQMKPVSGGVPEPEAAGAIAWILYQAYTVTGEERYRVGAEWAMEFLNGLQENPAYELQLAYGAYIAARMNAELGTAYDVEKLVNWCFDVGPLRSWGAIVGNWGGYDVSGLIGEVSANDYAFLMNGFEQAGALVPLTRYDDRFSRAIAKWVLNLANASRLFYPAFLPPENQDSEAWSYAYDPNSVIGHEAMRKMENGASPYATGDAVRGGWGRTNLALYSSSHVGILGAILDTTNVPMILKLDLLKTDYFHRPAFPTFLLFNPYDSARTVQLAVGDAPVDVYDAVENRFVAQGVTGLTPVSIPADAARQLVLVPAGGEVTFEQEKMRVNGVVVDFRSGRQVANHPPRIKALAANDSVAFVGDTLTVFCTAADADGDSLAYSWWAGSGEIRGRGAAVQWIAAGGGSATLRCRVTDPHGAADSSFLTIRLLQNRAPVIDSLGAARTILEPGDTTRIRCAAFDPDGDALTYFWEAPAGGIVGSGPEVVWQAPDSVGFYRIVCRVQDAAGAASEAELGITVGSEVAYYPLDGDANDFSGFGNPGVATGVRWVPGVRGGSLAAAFDGIDDVIRVPLQPYLNFTAAITVAFWMRVDSLPPRESFPISHGSWQNRWKVSLIPEKKLRWTLNTSAGIADLDSKQTLAVGKFYAVAVTYDGQSMQIYLDGRLDAARGWSGALRPTSFDLTLGQMLPGNPQYNFRGLLDEVRIYNRALSAEEIRRLYESPTPVEEAGAPLPDRPRLLGSYPNPFNPRTTIVFELAAAARVSLAVYDPRGRLVRRLADQWLQPGVHRFVWDGRTEVRRPAASGVYFVQLRAGERRFFRKLLLLR